MNLENINMKIKTNYRMRFPLFIVAFLILVSACSTKWQLNNSVKTHYAISKDLPMDSAMLAFQAPFKKRLDSNMNDIIAVAETEIARGKPEGKLNNLFADAMYWTGKQQGMSFDIAYTNYGGLRLPLPKGNIPLYKIYELMPFENRLVAVTFSGSDMQLFLDYIAEGGGDPVSGVRFEISNKKAVNISINGSPLDKAKEYVVLTSDYMANQGDGGYIFAKSYNRKEYEIKLRDALLLYIKQQTQAGKTLNPQLDGRITLD
ncbi:MAG: 5'-nucleotidase C-terminal domain-containing protein [Sphingobacteriaceae bacterium]